MKSDQDITKFLVSLHNESDKTVRLITADNSNAYTNFGTNTYIIGNQNLAVIDPGPNLSSHYENIKSTIGKSNLSHILLTHSHQDHCSLAVNLAVEYEAIIYMSYSCKLSKRELIKRVQGNSSGPKANEKLINRLQIQNVKDYQEIFNDEWCLEVIMTPGHMFDHICFALEGTDIIFSGDHVMGWSSTMIIPPMGNMGQFIVSLEKLLNRRENIYLPGHGSLITEAKKYVQSQLTHKKNREHEIISWLKTKPFASNDLVKLIYPNLNPELTEAANQNVFAHLINLVEKNLVSCETKISIKSKFVLLTS